VTRFWHPFADMGRVEAGGELVLERGEGVWLWDEQGKRYLDATAGLWFCNVGHGRLEIADAAARQLGTLAHYSGYGDFAARPVLELAEWVTAVAPVPGSAVFFTSGGGEAVDTAAKLVRRYWSLLGQPERTVIVARERAYHGLNAYGTSLAGSDVFTAGYGTLVADVLHVPWDSASALAAAIERAGPDRIAAFFCEPVIGAGGVLAPPPGYLAEVRRICRETGALFLADEVICGFGRCGDWFASSRWGLEPDLITFAKGVTSGYVQLGGVIASPQVQEPFWRPDGGVFWRHGYTYSGHAGAAAAGLANLGIFEREHLCARGLALETEIAEALAPLAEHPLVAEVRAGTGAMAAVQLDPAAVAADPTLPDRAVLAAREAGILTRMVLGNGFQVSPALTIERAELDELSAGLAAALDACAALAT
jgi:adenosylmethionine-8-amino-7-oxononanoate aminotransferase